MKLSRGIFLFFLTLVFASTAFAAEFSDNFDDQKLDPNYWSVIESDHGSLQEVGGGVDMYVPNGISGFTGIASKCQVVGDFDIQADFELTTFNTYWSSASLQVQSADKKNQALIYVSISKDSKRHYESPYIKDGVQRMPFGYYTPDLWAPVNEFDGLKNGKLRFVRQGSQITSYYFHNDEWQHLTTNDVFDQPGTVSLSIAGSMNNPTVSVIWDNYSAKSGQLSGCEEPTKTVAIEVRHSINPRNKGVIPVVILGTADFDATTIDPGTVLFGKTGIEAAAVKSNFTDVDSDGYVDLLVHFKTEESGIQCGDKAVHLTGTTFDQKKIIGTDSIKTAGCQQCKKSVRKRAAI